MELTSENITDAILNEMARKKIEAELIDGGNVLPNPIEMQLMFFNARNEINHHLQLCN